MKELVDLDPLCIVVQTCFVIWFRIVDLGFQRDPFTWSRDRLKERLDRMLINMNWRLTILKASLFDLPFFKLDH
jgi:hypothetical protein